MEKQRKILVVEDNLIQQELLRKWIEELSGNYRVYLASSPDEALEAAMTENFELIVMDIELKSDVNGFELALRLREYPKYKMTWIVFLTIERAFELKAYREVHCYAFLDKPYPKCEFQKTIREILEHSEQIERTEYLVISYEQVTLRIRRDEIIFIEAKGRGCSVYSTRGQYDIPYKSLKQILELLDNAPEFLKVHRSFILNYHYIKKINKYGIKQYEVEFYDCEKKAFLSNKYREDLENLINNRRL